MKENNDNYEILLDGLSQLTEFCFSVCMLEEEKYENIETHKMFQAAKILVSSYTKLTKILEVEDPRMFKVTKTQYDTYKNSKLLNNVLNNLLSTK